MKPYFETSRGRLYNGDCIEIWNEYKRICKNNAAIVLFSQPPFNIHLAMSNIKWFKYEWIWNKEQGTGFLNAKNAPLKITENILVFYKSKPIYNPQIRTGFKPYIAKQGSKSTNYNNKNNKNNNIVTNSNGERYPINLLEFTRDKHKLHPTQKPIALCEYLINTYTNEGLTVLDNTAGSGSTLIAAEKLNRKWIGIEIGKEYCDIIKQRLNSVDAVLP